MWNVIEVNEASFIIHPIHICACQGRVRKASQPQPPSNLYDKDTIDQSHREKISLKAKTDPTSQSGREKTGVQITELVWPIPEGLVIIFLLDLLPISKSLFGLGTCLWHGDVKRSSWVFSILINKTSPSTTTLNQASLAGCDVLLSLQDPELFSSDLSFCLLLTPSVMIPSWLLRVRGL